MKIKMLSPCERVIKNELSILDVNQILTLDDAEAFILINDGLAKEVKETTGSLIESVVNAENKMVNILYKKRGRPRKED